MVQTLRTPAADAYRTHADYWEDSGGDRQLPIDPFKVADRMGIRVYAAVLGPRRDGYLDFDPNGSPVIYVNESHSLNRQRFTVAHEIGHFVDAKRNGTSIRTTFDRDEVASRGTDPHEIYANRFAAAFLMPKSDVLRLRNQGFGPSDMARRFRVSETAMELRLRNLGLR